MRRYHLEMLVADLLGSLDDRFPLRNAASWDPVGLQLGDSTRSLGTVGVTHEVTEAAVDSVLSGGISTLVTYHPLLFDPLVAITAGSTAPGRSLRLIEGGVSVLVVHTSLDAAPYGTGDALLASLGIEPAGMFAAGGEEYADRGIGRFGSLDEPMTAGSFASLVVDVIATRVQFAGSPEASIQTVAVVPGSGGSFIGEAGEIADVYVTGDVSHHQARLAIDHGLVVIDAGHIPTERAGVEYLYDSVRDLVSNAVFISSDPHPWEDIPWKT